MIRYALRCENGHDFDGWFRSSDAFETTLAAGHVACTQCGSAQVRKSLMAPSVASERPAKPAENPLEAALQALRQQVEANSDYVGLKFADEARAMHEGRIPRRSIHGEARPEEARKLIEDGIPVAPLPFRASRKLT